MGELLSWSEAFFRWRCNALQRSDDRPQYLAFRPWSKRSRGCVINGWPTSLDEKENKRIAKRCKQHRRIASGTWVSAQGQGDQGNKIGYFKCFIGDRGAQKKERGRWRHKDRLHCFLGRGKVQGTDIFIDMMGNVIIENKDRRRSREKELATIGTRERNWNYRWINKAKYDIGNWSNCRWCKWGTSRHIRRKDTSEEERRNYYYDYNN